MSSALKRAAWLAQNWDWHPEQRPYTLLLITRDEQSTIADIRASRVR